jgi:hypothetical protein
VNKALPEEMERFMKCIIRDELNQKHFVFWLSQKHFVTLPVHCSKEVLLGSSRRRSTRLETALAPLTVVTGTTQSAWSSGWWWRTCAPSARQQHCLPTEDKENEQEWNKPVTYLLRQTFSSILYIRCGRQWCYLYLLTLLWPGVPSFLKLYSHNIYYFSSNVEYFKSAQFAPPMCMIWRTRETKLP